MNTGFLPESVGARGVDVSHYQEEIDWGLVAKAGMAFAFIKATDGTSQIDPQFHTNWNGAHEAGLLRGAYHFYQPGLDPQQQAQNFLSVAQIGPGDLPSILDVEAPGDPREIISGIEAWLDKVMQATRKVPILYTNPGFWKTLNTLEFGRFPLWISDPGVALPTLPQGWMTWTFWQYSQNSSIPGILNPVDLDCFQGTLEDLQAMAQSQV